MFVSILVLEQPSLLAISAAATFTRRSTGKTVISLGLITFAVLCVLEQIGLPGEDLDAKDAEEGAAKDGEQAAARVRARLVEEQQRANHREDQNCHLVDG